MFTREVPLKFSKKKKERREKREEVAEIIDRIVVTRGEEQQMSN